MTTSEHGKGLLIGSIALVNEESLQVALVVRRGVDDGTDGRRH